MSRLGKVEEMKLEEPKSNIQTLRNVVKHERRNIRITIAYLQGTLPPKGTRRLIMFRDVGERS
jgi:hypothetical protein